MALQRGQRQINLQSKMGVVPVADSTALDSLVQQLGPTVER